MAVEPPMWYVRSEQLAAGRILRTAINSDSTPVSYAEVMHCWQQDADFRSFYASLLADAPFAAFLWETPPITTATANRPFEFVLCDSPGLANEPDAAAFAEHFRGATETGVVEFPLTWAAMRSRSCRRRSARTPVPCSPHGGEATGQRRGRGSPRAR
jgi:hypothetical protein